MERLATDSHQYTFHLSSYVDMKLIPQLILFEKGAVELDVRCDEKEGDLISAIDMLTGLC